MRSRGKFGSRMWLIDRLFHQQFRRVIQYVKGIVVDLGCGEKPFQRLLVPHASRYIGVDMVAGKADIIADITKLPLTTGSADSVLCFQVLDDLLLRNPPTSWTKSTGYSDRAACCCFRSTKRGDNMIRRVTTTGSLSSV